MAQAKKSVKTTAKKTIKKAAKEAELVVETMPEETVMPTVTAEEVAETTTDVPEEAESAEPKTAKAGKRSAKAIAEADEKEAKEERKTAAAEDGEPKPKGPVAKTRTRLERRAKGFRKSAEALEAGKVYGLDEAILLAKKTSHVKFDATVELHVNLSVDPPHRCV